ncbi:cytochrome P450 [Yoonia sp.]|uniref:cytochrome P450 n=1 Tax=Yoonia sp. TaxID=2212373 RepID=UPI0025E090B0|nr:cytochrome P450 [Yoonia sp.]
MPSPLAHIPALPAKPIVGHTLDVLNDSYGLHRRSAAAFGPVYKIKLLGKWRVSLGGADALEFILGDTDNLFSSAGGWEMLDVLFGGGLMLRDFGDHRAHRRIMQAAFRKPVLDLYRTRMAAALDPLIARWPAHEPFAFFPEIKTMTLQMGAAVFMGLPVDDPRVPKLNQAFIDEVAASMGVVRAALPFTKIRRGVKARAYLRDTFRALIPERRAAGGDDFFSQMCLARDDDGNCWSDDEIIDHFNFLLMAAHDTTAATLTKMIWAMATFPEWQDRMIAEVDALGDAPLDDAALAAMDVTDRVLREALRLLPPVPFIPRRATRDFTFNGVDVPGGTWVTAMAGMVMMSSVHWTDPDSFDPDRFSPNRAEDQSHRYAWAPFGGGAHKCIGLHFATMQVKVFMALLLRRFRVELAQGTPVVWKRMPIPSPKGGLPVRLIPR